MSKFDTFTYVKTRTAYSKGEKIVIRQKYVVINVLKLLRYVTC